MLVDTTKTPTCLEDIFNDDPFGLLDISDEQAALFVEPNHYKPSSKAGYVAGIGEVVAKQTACTDYHLYEARIDNALSIIKNGGFKKVAANINNIKVDSIFVFEGLVAVVVAIQEAEQRNSGQKHRARVIYSNGTESNLLLSTLVAKTYKNNCYSVEITNNQGGTK